MKKKTIRAIMALVALGVLFAPAAHCEDACCPAVSRDLAQAPDGASAFQSLEKAAACCFKQQAYAECCACVRDAAQKNKNALNGADYFCALARYRQLKHLEEKQLWDEYFAKGNEYREEISSNLDKVFKETRPQDPVHLAARLLAYRFHKDMEDALAEETLASLMTAAAEYARTAVDAGLLKEAAQALEGYNERGKSKELYKMYINKTVAGVTAPGELSAMAFGFLKDGNLELAESVCDVYIGKLDQSADKKAAVAELARLADAFVYKDEGLKDPQYAEKVFAKIEDLEGKEAFGEELLYLRGYNLEKAQEWARAKDIYADFLAQFASGARAGKVAFKLGVLSAYCLRDLKAAREYFQKLGEKEHADAHVIAGLYQLGLFAQWEDDVARAKGAYAKILEKAGSNYPETTALTKQRMNEIEENKLLDSRIKDMLDASLRPEYAIFDMSRVQIAASKYNPAKGEEVSISSTAAAPQSGCMQVNLEYFWAGDGIPASAGPEATSIKTSFKEPGTKVIGLLVKTPSGLLDRAVDFVDVE
ncbi:MAG: hypothetical protein PHT59_01170 [Candidatus Omnitrophica bacterium]|nr:hypothetical protein [Candidatus Omnitrophota bacterium]